MPSGPMPSMPLPSCLSPSVRTNLSRPLLLMIWLASAPAFCAAHNVPETGSGTADAVDSGWILSRLARPAPTRTVFVEVRDSRLLKAPLRIEGEYRRPVNDTLVREVRLPYAETTTIQSGTVSIARAGKSARTFSLARVPELAGLQASFGALLSGDRQLLEQHYRLASAGTHQRWTMVLTPKDVPFAAKVRNITLYGRGAELRCIETASAKTGDLQRTLLAGAARDASGVSTSTALAALCRNDNTSHDNTSHDNTSRESTSRDSMAHDGLHR